MAINFGNKQESKSIESGATSVLRTYEHNETTLYKCILYASLGDLGGLKRLYLKGYSLSQGDYDQSTPLHLAASNGHVNVVKYLSTVLMLQDMMPKDRWDNTPYDDAKREGKVEVLQFLEQYKFTANNNVKSKDTVHTGRKTITLTNTYAFLLFFFVFFYYVSI